jgi:hypothetical protein
MASSLAAGYRAFLGAALSGRPLLDALMLFLTGAAIISQTSRDYQPAFGAVADGAVRS